MLDDPIPRVIHLDDMLAAVSDYSFGAGSDGCFSGLEEFFKGRSLILIALYEPGEVPRVDCARASSNDIGGDFARAALIDSNICSAAGSVN